MSTGVTDHFDSADAANNALRSLKGLVFLAFRWFRQGRTVIRRQYGRYLYANIRELMVYMFTSMPRPIW